MSSQQLKADLFTTAMKGDWKKVVQMYKEHPDIHRAKITRSRDTALHIAISDGQDRIVEQLVDLIKESDNRGNTPEALTRQNERGNTPLHLAASLGNFRMCKCIASVDTGLIGCRNKDNETPFFLAALHGRKDAFLCLHSFLEHNPSRGHLFCRGKHGDTILHCAIAGEHFDLAFQIINLYEDLVNGVNEHGISPLHLLASKPSAFRSGSHMTRYYKLIYHCIFVDKLEVQTHPRQPLFQELEYSDSAQYPENYQICANIAWLIGKVSCLLAGSGKKYPGQQSDVEDPGREKLRSKEKAGSGKKDPGQQSDPEDTNREQLHRKEKAGGGKKDPDKQSDAEDPNRKPLQRKEEGLKAKGHHLFPANYLTCFEAIKLVSKAMLIIFGLGSRELVKIQERKEKHVWSEQILDELLQRTSTYEYEHHGRNPKQSLSDDDDDKDDKKILLTFDGSDVGTPKQDSEESDSHDNIAEQNKKNSADEGCFNFHATVAKNLEGCFTLDGTIAKNSEKMDFGGKGGETPLLIAAKNGVAEMVKKILQKFPMAIHDVNSDLKNIVLLVVEHRQPHIYEFLLKMKAVKESIFRKVDKGGNSALHLAASLGEYRPWLIPGAALQMQWEIRWYEYVKNSMPLHFFVRLNHKGRTPKDIFNGTHKELVKSGGEWLKSTSESCSVVAALIATVAFATAATVPGGVKPDKGTPVLENESAFECFAISSLVALCFSLTSLVMFLSILTSRYQEKDFGISLPRKLLLGLTSLFVSIASMLISFCAGHFFVLKEKLKYVAFPVYAVTCLPVTFFAMAQFPLYFDLMWATFKKVPQRSYKVVRF